MSDQNQTQQGTSHVDRLIAAVEAYDAEARRGQRPPKESVLPRELENHPILNKTPIEAMAMLHAAGELRKIAEAFTPPPPPELTPLQQQQRAFALARSNGLPTSINGSANPFHQAGERPAWEAEASARGQRVVDQAREVADAEAAQSAASWGRINQHRQQLAGQSNASGIGGAWAARGATQRADAARAAKAAAQAPRGPSGSMGLRGIRHGSE